MKNKIKLISIIVLIALNFNSFGQLQTANRYFKLYRFAEAIPLYKKVIDKKSDEKRAEAIVRIADCYRLINNSLEAKSWYSQAVENPKTDAINYFYLGQALCELENHADAIRAFAKYKELVPSDPKGQAYIDFCTWAMENNNVYAKSVVVKNEESLNTQWSDFSPVKYKDSIVFTSDRVMKNKNGKEFQWTGNDYLDIYFSTPKYYKDFWIEMTEPKPFFEKINHNYHNGLVMISKDGKMMLIARTDRKKVKITKDKIKTHVVKMFYATIEPGKKPKFLPFFLNSDEYSVSDATLTSDGKTMIFATDKPGGTGESDLYLCTWQNGNWTNAKNLGPTINTFGNDRFPSLVNDTILIFASDGRQGYGGLDLYISYKRDTTWSEPKNMMKPINSSYDDFGMLLFDDLKSGFFSSNRPEGKGLDDIYAFKNWDTTNVKELVAVKPGVDPKVVLSKLPGSLPDTNKAYIAGYVKDKSTNKPLDQATVFLYNPQSGKVKILKTGPDGYYKSMVERPADFSVKAMKSDYIADCLPWDIDKIEPGTIQNAPRDLLLDKLDLNKSFVLKNIYYDFDKYFIRDDAKPDLNKVIKIMQDNPNVIAELSSHTDCRGTFDYNNTLSQNRANAAVDYIVSNGGILPGRILARGYGEYRLTNKCKDGVPCTEAEHQDNRRTEFKVIGFTKPIGLRGQFDPGKFAAGETFDIKWLPENFFYPCDLVNETPVMNTTTPEKIQLTKSADQQISNEENPQYHSIVAGETLNSIALKYKTSVQKLKDLNKLSSDKILVGQKLKLF